MILSLDNLKSIVLKNPNKHLIANARAYSKKLRAHLRGIGSMVDKIEGYERTSVYNIRSKYAKSNKDIFSRLSRPMDKVFSARGGSVRFNLPGESEKKAIEYSANVKDGYTSKKWIESFWLPHYLDDPAGVILMEILPTPEAVQAKKDGLPFVYPTYKSIDTIYDYQPKGNQLEYIALIVDGHEKEQYGYKKEDSIYRVIDDANDYWIKRESEEDITILTAQTLPNYFTYVPAIINSDIIDPSIEGAVLSFFDSVIELADQYLIKGSIKATHDFLHGFPKYWEYADNCIDCLGSGKIDAKPCPVCKGTGKSIMTKVSDAKMLIYPSKEDVQIAPNVAGYVSPDKTYWEICTADLSMLEDLMHFTAWGVSSNIRTQGLTNNKQGEAKTATQVMDEIRPQSDRLEIISDSAQLRQKFIMDAIITIQLRPNYTGCSIQYGRRFMLEGPDALWMKYSDARIKGAAISVLDDLLLKYYEAEYSHDPVRLAIQSKLSKVEPFVHMTAIQVQLLNVSPEDKTAKLYFGDWLAITADGLILTLPVDLLRKDLLSFVSKKVIQPEPINQLQ